MAYLGRPGATAPLTSADIPDNSITAAKIVADTIAAGDLAPNSVDSSELVDGSVDLSHMSANSVDSDQYVDGSIDTAHIGDDQVTGDKLANDIAISTTGAITTTGAFTSVGIDDNADATAVTIDSNENVAIGDTSTNSNTLRVKDSTAFVSGASNVANTAPLNVRSSAVSGGIGAISLGGNDNVAIFNHAANGLGLQSYTDMIFYCSNTNDDKIGTKTERMRIAASNGDVTFKGVARVNTGGNATMVVGSAQGTSTLIVDADNEAWIYLQRLGGNIWSFHNSVGNSNRLEVRDAEGNDGVLLSQGGTSWGSGSDERLKCNWTPFNDALSDINSLTKIGTFQFKNFGEDVPRNDVIHSGLSAQEVHKFLPSAIDEGGDENKLLTMRYQDLIPVLAKAIQELSTKNDALEAENTALKTRMDALEARVTALEG